MHSITTPLGSINLGSIRLAAWCLFLLVCLGCRTGQDRTPRSSATVSLGIQNSQTEAIRQAAIEVFRADLFQCVYAGPEHLVFEKPGTTMQGLTYGGWYENEVWVRLKVDITRYGTNAHLLECDVLAVTSHGDSFFEEERRMLKIGKGHYKDLLKQVRDKCASSAPAP